VGDTLNLTVYTHINFIRFCSYISIPSIKIFVLAMVNSNEIGQKLFPFIGMFVKQFHYDLERRILFSEVSCTNQKLLIHLRIQISLYKHWQTRNSPLFDVMIAYQNDFSLTNILM
jgi:hypothetical protein